MSNVEQRGFIALNVCHEDEHIDTVLQAFGKGLINIATCVENRSV